MKWGEQHNKTREGKENEERNKKPKNETSPMRDEKFKKWKKEEELKKRS